MLDDPQTRPRFITAAGDQTLDAYLRARETGALADVNTAIALLRSAAAAGILPPDLLIRAIASLGRTDLAFELMSLPGSAIQQDGPGFLLEPSMIALRRDPRFWDVAVRAGLVDYWSRRGVWPDFCGAELPLATCKTRADMASRAAQVAGKTAQGH